MKEYQKPEVTIVKFTSMEAIATGDQMPGDESFGYEDDDL